MAARFEQEEPAPKECANCGATDHLLRCSRCHAEWFCSLACHKAYWPFHKHFCARNDFADAVEASDPRFAAWLRRHGKQAVLGDAEVERLERAGRAVSGPGRQEAMGAMYGKLDPRPEGPKYSPEEQQRVVQRVVEEQRTARLMSRQDKAWAEVAIPPGMGMECSRYKWYQNQSHVHVFVLLPDGLPASSARVELSTARLGVTLGSAGSGEQPHMRGELYGRVQVEGSTWFVDDGVLHVQLLKTHRRGHYRRGGCNADTWWRSVWAACPAGETLQQQLAPTLYYWAEYEEGDLPEEGAAPAAALPPPPPHTRRQRGQQQQEQEQQQLSH